MDSWKEAGVRTTSSRKEGVDCPKRWKKLKNQRGMGSECDGRHLKLFGEDRHWKGITWVRTGIKSTNTLGQTKGGVQVGEKENWKQERKRSNLSMIKKELTYDSVRGEVAFGQYEERFRWGGRKETEVSTSDKETLGNWRDALEHG